MLEVLIALVMYNISKKDPSLKWVKTFAIGITLHGLSVLGEQFLAWHNPLGLLTPTVRAVSLCLVFCSLLEGVGKLSKEMVAITAAIAIYFAVAVTIFMALKIASMKILLFEVPHVLLTVLLPLFIAWVLYGTYKETQDPSALALAGGLVVYALGVLLAIIMTAGGATLLQALVVKDALWTIGFAIMLAGIMKVAKEL